MTVLKLKDDLYPSMLMDKYGFKPKFDEDTGIVKEYVQYIAGRKIKFCKKKKFNIIIARKSKSTNLCEYEWVVERNSNFEYSDIMVLYDLIKDGIIEKVQR